MVQRRLKPLSMYFWSFCCSFNRNTSNSLISPFLGQYPGHSYSYCINFLLSHSHASIKALLWLDFGLLHLKCVSNIHPQLLYFIYFYFFNIFLHVFIYFHEFNPGHWSQWQVQIHELHANINSHASGFFPGHHAKSRYKNNTT